MRTQVRALGLILVFAFAGSGFAAKKPSKISAFAGSYIGSVIYSGAGQSYTGPSTARFSASKKKETGTLNINSTLAGAIPFTETFSFQKKLFSYTLNAGGQLGFGSGTVHVGKKVVTYFGSFSVAGSPYSLQGTIRMSGRKLIISETYSGSVVISVNYTLTKKGKK